MRILLLSDSASEHTEKWALGLANSGIEIGLFSFNKSSVSWHAHKNISVLFEPKQKPDANNSFTKISYLSYFGRLKKAIRTFKPDILHAHYATSYGLLGALSGFHPFVVSAWGTDVMKFPEKNFVAKSILHYNLKKADLICATSYTIEEYVDQVIKKPVSVIPFGINTEVFVPQRSGSLFAETDFVIGCIKPLEKLYNTDVVIKAFSLLQERYPALKLLIVGAGSTEKDLRTLTKDLSISDKVIFTGRIPFSQINRYYNMLDVLVNISEYESFGVCVIEAMACEKPVIVTNVGGLKEIVNSDAVGLKVEVGNVKQTADAVERLMTDKTLYQEIAHNARKHVVKKYNWHDNLRQMILEYNKLVAKTTLI